MKARIEPGAVTGIFTAPSSKSYTQRAYAAALLHKGSTTIHNPGSSDDERAALDIIQQLGAVVTSQTATKIELFSNGVNPIHHTINCGESGLAARLFTPIAALSEKPSTVTGSGSLLKRPMEGFANVFPQLSVQLPGFEKYLPVSIKGPMVAANIKMNAEGGSQLLTGLLFALCNCATKKVTISVAGLKSKPYIDMTLEVLEQSDKKVINNNYSEFIVDPALFVQKNELAIHIEGDWSSGAYFLVAGAIAGSVTVKNLNPESKQADKAILKVLDAAGANVVTNSEGITVTNAKLTAFEFDATDCPDLFPVLAILAACCEGESSICGVHRLFYKESNRVESITEMLQYFGVHFSVEEDTLYVEGVYKLQGTVIDSYNDHRIAMAAAIGALRANGPVDITNPTCINKSYPDFFKDLALCGGRVTLPADS